MWTLTLTTPRSVLLCEFFQKKSYFARSNKLVLRKITCVAQASIPLTLMCTTRMYATLQPLRRHEQYVSSKKFMPYIAMLISG